MLHVRNTAKEFCRKLKSEGFNGVQLDAYVSGKDMDYLDEMTPEQNAAWDRDYCCITVVPYFELVTFSVDSDYVSFDERAWWNDFYCMMREAFGQDVEWNHRPRAQEFEVSRRSLAESAQ